VATRPKEFDELTKLLHPRGEQVFFGAYDPDAPPVGACEPLVIGSMARPWKSVAW
jgi:menaquinone-dependent protoporphyrinogen oxidase